MEVAVVKNCRRPAGTGRRSLTTYLEKQMVSRKEWYVRANSVWPAEVPALTAPEAVRAARKLYRFVRRRVLPIPIKVTSGNRYSYSRRGVLSVNPNGHHFGGWKDLVHDLSHWLGGGHSKDHARLEARMVREVVRRGWLTGSLKDKPKAEKQPEDPKAKRYKAVVIRMDRWLAKKKRAERALARLARQRKRYERLGLG